MILQSLVQFYEELAAKGEIPRPGWSKVRVQFAIEIDFNGNLLSILPLESTNEKGKPIPRFFEVPSQFKRSGSRAPAYFLCDNSQYCLGLENGRVTEKSIRCFSAFCEYHKEILSTVETKNAQALIRFLDAWEPQCALQNNRLASMLDFISKGGNYIFSVEGGQFLHEDQSIVRKWSDMSDENAAVIGRCLVTGEKTEIARIHNSLKGLRTSNLSPNGWTLVGFDKEAFCSYGKTQSYNAPVGKYAALAYTTALNYLLAQKRADGRPKARLIGDTTTVFWAEDAQTQYQDAFAAILDGEDENIVTSKDLEAFMDAIAKGADASWDSLPVKPDNHFYVLGLAPNAARLSVRFFLQDDFGCMVKHIKKHYDLIKITSDNRNKWEMIPLWSILQETVNKKAKNKSPSPQMAGDMLRAILTGGLYPATLYQQTQLRIRAERDVTRGRAAIIKAYLSRNLSDENNKEALTVELNEQTKYQPYVLGRLFSVLEAIQQKANPGINTTIKDKYFSSACATPAAVFPILINLAQKHLRKMDVGANIYYSKLLGKLTELISESYPVHMTLAEQGVFQLGYYHQTQKRYEKKSIENNKEVTVNV